MTPSMARWFAKHVCLSALPFDWTGRRESAIVDEYADDEHDDHQLDEGESPVCYALAHVGSQPAQLTEPPLPTARQNAPVLDCIGWLWRYS